MRASLRSAFNETGFFELTKAPREHPICDRIETIAQFAEAQFGGQQLAQNVAVPFSLEDIQRAFDRINASSRKIIPPLSI